MVGPIDVNVFGSHGRGIASPAVQVVSPALVGVPSALERRVGHDAVRPPPRLTDGGRCQLGAFKATVRGDLLSAARTAVHHRRIVVRRRKGAVRCRLTVRRHHRRPTATSPLMSEAEPGTPRRIRQRETLEALATKSISGAVLASFRSRSQLDTPSLNSVWAPGLHVTTVGPGPTRALSSYRKVADELYTGVQEAPALNASTGCALVNTDTVGTARITPAVQPRLNRRMLPISPSLASRL